MSKPGTEARKQRQRKTLSKGVRHSASGGDQRKDQRRSVDRTSKCPAGLCRIRNAAASVATASHMMRTCLALTRCLAAKEDFWEAKKESAQWKKQREEEEDSNHIRKPGGLVNDEPDDKNYFNRFHRNLLHRKLLPHRSTPESSWNHLGDQSERYQLAKLSGRKNTALILKSQPMIINHCDYSEEGGTSCSCQPPQH